MAKGELVKDVVSGPDAPYMVLTLSKREAVFLEILTGGFAMGGPADDLYDAIQAADPDLPLTEEYLTFEDAFEKQASGAWQAKTTLLNDLKEIE